jgi:hypothetical protein
MVNVVVASAVVGAPERTPVEVEKVIPLGSVPPVIAYEVGVPPEMIGENPTMECPTVTESLVLESVKLGTAWRTKVPGAIATTP